MLFQCAPSHPPKALLQCITWWHAEDAGRWARKGSRYTGTYCTAGGSNCTAIIGTPVSAVLLALQNSACTLHQLINLLRLTPEHAAPWLGT
eukprot:1140291-Pelagomonas_calceolata.AAC.2